MDTAKVRTRRWDAAEHLNTVEDMVLYLDAAFEEGDASWDPGPWEISPVPRG